MFYARLLAKEREECSSCFRSWCTRCHRYVGTKRATFAEEVTPQRKSETKRTSGELQDSVAISQSLIESFTRHKTRNFILEVSKPADRPDIMHTTGETQGIIRRNVPVRFCIIH